MTSLSNLAGYILFPGSPGGSVAVLVILNYLSTSSLCLNHVHTVQFSDQTAIRWWFYLAWQAHLT